MKKWSTRRKKEIAAKIEESAEAAQLQLMGKLIIEKLHVDAIIPTYASDGDSGMDVYAVEDITLQPGETKIIKIGIKMEIPRHPLHELGYRFECQVRPKSGISAATLIRMANAPGTVDNFFRDEIGVILTNTADRVNLLYRTDHFLDLKGNKVPVEDVETAAAIPAKTYLIRKGNKIAQLVFNEVIRPLVIEEGIVNDEDSRGGGFGHTGI